jgi:TPR repeat protein
MYNEGKGVPQDYKEAVKWWKLAAGQHDEQAQFILERMHGNSLN